jgi:hypothetical protein
MTESPCDFHCGYYSSGRDLYDHVCWEHRDCTECGAKAPERPYSLTHRPDCPRLQPGYVYPSAGSGYVPYDVPLDDEDAAPEAAGDKE